MPVSAQKDLNMQGKTKIDTFVRKYGEGECNLLKKLYALDEEMSLSGAGGIPSLILSDAPERYGGTILYRPHLTPSNALSFASTGGDDVHFSLLKVGKGFGDDSPVVMTVPMAGDTPEETNIILGENLHEFLCLGCVHGFFGLEQLMYCRTETLEEYSQPEHEEDTYLYDEDTKAAFQLFRDKLGLTPWSDIPSHLLDLQERFDQLKFRWSWLRRLGRE